MSYLLASIDPLPVLVRDEFLYNLESGHGKFSSGYAIGFRSVPGRVPSFQVLLGNGAQWASIPLHALCVKECPPEPLEELTWWDCFDYTFEYVKLDILSAMRCQLLTPAKKVHQGRYIATVDYHGGFADLPDQHKNHHLIALDSGHIAAYPNNKILWRDPSFITEQKPPPYRVNTHVWSVEASPRPVSDTNATDYGHKPA